MKAMEISNKLTSLSALSDFLLELGPLFLFARLMSKNCHIDNNGITLSNTRSSEDVINKKFTLYIYLNHECRAKGFLYLTDGHSTLYQ